MKHGTKIFAFAKGLLSRCTINEDYGWCGKRTIWDENITKEKQKEILSILKFAFKDNVAYNGSHYIPSKESYGITYTRYSNFKWSKDYSNQLWCDTTTLTIISDNVFVYKERIDINPNFTETLVNSADALSEIQTKFDKIINKVMNYKAVR